MFFLEYLIKILGKAFEIKRKNKAKFDRARKL